LLDAAKVAEMLGRPLLLTGEPGTGKTQFAYYLAWQLELGEPLKFEAKSTTTARDLVYTFDALGLFHAAQTRAGTHDPSKYVRLNAFGLAIALANAPATVAHLLPSGVVHRAPRRSLLLIDEIDKAPRDLPNDLLNELEHLYFRISEVDNMTLLAPRQLSPFVVITSNSEKHLPEAFLRRCIYYDIPFPSDEGLKEIVANRIDGFTSGKEPLLVDVLAVFERLRRPDEGLEKKPGTAELLDWLMALLGNGAARGKSLRTQADIGRRTLNALLKTSSDQRRGAQIFQSALE
jgi:MoxR-like ATPase